MSDGVLERRIEERREARPTSPPQRRSTPRPGSRRSASPASGGSAGRPRRRVSGDARRRTRIGAASAIRGAVTMRSSRCWTMWTENRVVSYRSIPDSSANARAVMAAAKATVRRRGTRLCGCAPFTRPTAHAHHSSPQRIASVGSGGNVQPRSRLAAVVAPGHGARGRLRARRPRRN